MTTVAQRGCTYSSSISRSATQFAALSGARLNGRLREFPPHEPVARPPERWLGRGSTRRTVRARLL